MVIRFSRTRLPSCSGVNSLLMVRLVNNHTIFEIYRKYPGIHHHRQSGGNSTKIPTSAGDTHGNKNSAIAVAVGATVAGRIGFTGNTWMRSVNGQISRPDAAPFRLRRRLPDRGSNARLPVHRFTRLPLSVNLRICCRRRLVQKIKVASLVSLCDMLREQGAVAALEMLWRLLPFGAAARELGVAYL